MHVMEIEHNGWQTMTHSQDGYFVFSSPGPINGDFRVRLTAINGVQIVDTIPGIRKWVILQNCVPLEWFPRYADNQRHMAFIMLF